MTTNAQAALQAAATYHNAELVTPAQLLDQAAEFKAWLDEQDAAERQLKGRIIPKRELDTVSKAFGKTPKPDNVVVMKPGQLGPSALELADAAPGTQWVSYEHALAQSGWVQEEQDQGPAANCHVCQGAGVVEDWEGKRPCVCQSGVSRG